MPNSNNTLVKLKTGNISDIEKSSGQSPVAQDAGTVYFAVSEDKKTGKILYDVDDEHRVTMSAYADYADTTFDGVELNSDSNIIHYGECSTVADGKNKVIYLKGFKLNLGARVIAKFANTNTASEPTLNVGSTGPRSIWYEGAAIPPEALQKNGIYEFVFDGVYWQYVGTIAANVGITLDEESKTLFITSPFLNGDGVSY